MIDLFKKLLLMKVLFLTNMPTPYRVDFCNCLSKYCQLTVFFEGKRTNRRKYNWIDESQFQFAYYFAAELRNEQKEIRKDVKQMSDILQDYIRKDDKKTIATLRTTLWQLHKGFMDQGYVTPDGLKTFSELGKVYEEAGGNDIYHDKLVPEVMSLEIRYPDGSIYKKG